MDQVLGFINHGMLAEGNNLLEMLGPLLLFGIYAIGALAKKWADSKKTESDEKPPSELQKAVRKRYQQIYERQTGNDAAANRPVPVRAEPVKTSPVRPLEKTPPKTQARTLLTPQLQELKKRPPVHQRQKYRQERRNQRKVAAKQTSAVIQRPQPATIKIVSIKQKCEGHSVLSMFQQPPSLQTAVIMKEILDKPLALRDF
jgi:hypothetical protein